MQWPDVIQIIATVWYNLTDNDVDHMSFEEQSKWLRQNPVTAATPLLFEHIFQVYLKSNAHPLSELLDFAIRTEFQASTCSQHSVN